MSSFDPDVILTGYNECLLGPSLLEAAARVRPWSNGWGRFPGTPAPTLAQLGQQYTQRWALGELWNGRNVCDVYALAEEAYACGGDMSLLAYAHWRDPVNRHALLPGVHIPYGETAATVNDLTSAAVAANLLDMTALTS